jgi:hypothetical protein
MNQTQALALIAPVENTEEMGRRWKAARQYNTGHKKQWLVCLVVAPADDDENYEWNATVRLGRTNKGGQLKTVETWSQQERAEANRILVQELVGVGQLMETKEEAGEHYVMMARPLTVEERDRLLRNRLLGDRTRKLASAARTNGHGG